LLIDPDGLADYSKVTNVNNVLSGKPWIDYTSNKTHWLSFSRFGKKYQCADYARAQVKVGSGQTPGPASRRIDMYIDKGRQTKPSKVDAQAAVDTIVSNLKEGNAVMVGVMYDHKKDTGNPNAATNHFLTVIGMGKDEEGAYFSYYDNYTAGKGKDVGTNLKLNRFRPNGKNGDLLFDADNTVPVNGNQENQNIKYLITEVRPNEK